MRRRGRDCVALRVEISPHAAEAVGEVMRLKAPSGLVEEPGQKKGTVALTCFFPTKRAADKAAAAVEERLQAHFPAASFSMIRHRVRAAEWEREWRRSWSAFEAAPGLIVKPPWSRRKTRPGETLIKLDPGWAFGTGEHPTTRQCLRALKSYMRQGWDVVDVGTGSGILAIAAAKLGAARAVGIDNDIRALQCARENVERNGVQDRVILIASDLLSGTRLRADLLIANLAPQPVQEVADCCGRVLRRGGFFVAAGISGEKAAALEKGLVRRRLMIIERVEDEGWTAFVCRSGNRR